MNITKDDLPNVAVLMATFNGEKYIRQQVDSVLQQKNVNVILYVRDDGSTDKTVQIVNEYHDATGKVFLLPAKSIQLRVTKNFYSIVREIDLANIDYMAYCDQDDIWLENKLTMAISAIQTNKVSCYASNLLRGDETANIIEQGSVFRKMVNYILNHKSNKQLDWDHYFEAASAGCTLVLNKEAALYFQHRINELYDRIPTDASHDWSTYAITRIGGFQWYIDERSYIIYRQHSSNAYGVNNGLKGVTKLLDLFTSGWYRKHIVMIDELYNNTALHPGFMDAVKNYRHTSISSRFRMAIAVSSHRRKRIHRILLFWLIIFGFCK